MVHGFWRHPELFDAAEESLASDRRLARSHRLRDSRHARARGLRPCGSRAQGPPRRLAHDHGYEPVDHGPFVYDALDDYPVFCLRAARARRPPSGSLGVVIGGSGNGEAIAANKVDGVRAALAWSEETARLGRSTTTPTSSPSAAGCTPSRTWRTSSRCSWPPRSAARSGTRGASRMLADYESTGSPPAAAGVGRPVTMPEGHTLFRLARSIESTSPAGSSRQQPAGTLRGVRRAARRLRLVGAESYGKHLFVEFGARPARARPPRPLRQVRRARGPGAAAGRPGPAAAGRRPRRHGHAASYGDLRGATACELMTAAAARPLLDRLGPDPLRPDADWTRAWARVSRSRGPLGGLLMDQSVLAGVGNVYRAEVLFRHRLHPLRPGNTAAPGQLRAAVGRPGAADGRRRPHRTHRHRPRRPHDPSAGGPGASGRTTDGGDGLRLPPQGEPCSSAAPGCAPRCSPAATCSGARAASRASGLAPGGRSLGGPVKTPR